MRLIDADALIESMGLANAVKWGNVDGYQQDHSYSALMRYEIKNEIDAQPTVPAVPLDKLCEWLGKETLPCLFCEYDVGEQCLNLQEQGCWKRVLTKWMEGLEDGKAD